LDGIIGIDAALHRYTRSPTTLSASGLFMGSTVRYDVKSLTKSPELISSWASTMGRSLSSWSSRPVRAPMLSSFHGWLRRCPSENAEGRAMSMYPAGGNPCRAWCSLHRARRCPTRRLKQVNVGVRNWLRFAIRAREQHHRASVERWEGAVGRAAAPSRTPLPP